MTTIHRKSARYFALGIIIGIVLMHAVLGFGCYQQDLPTFLMSVAYFILPPLLPAIITLFFPNPLRSVVASVFFMPWLLLAYYTDCIAPYEGGGASMVFVVVLFGGFVTSLIGAILGGWIVRLLKIQVVAQ